MSRRRRPRCPTPSCNGRRAVSGPVYPRLAQQSDQDFDVLRDRIFGVAREASRIYLSLDFEDAQDRFAGFAGTPLFRMRFR